MSGAEGHALVLGGGGVSGIAWLTGMFHGIEEEGVDAVRADLVLGTSAGGAVAAQITSGTALSDLFARQVDRERQVHELVPTIRVGRLLVRLAPGLPLMLRRDPRPFRRFVGRLALGAQTVEPATRTAVIEARLPRHEWPEVALGIIAADVATGELRSFDRASGVSLVEAVAASCAVPTVWPTVRIQGRDYIDGGLPSADNTVFAAGHSSALVVSPLGGNGSGALKKRLRREVAALESSGTRAHVLVPDVGSRAAFGRNALDPANRPASAEAGRVQGRRVAAELGTWLMSARSA